MSKTAMGVIAVFGCFDDLVVAGFQVMRIRKR